MRLALIGATGLVGEEMLRVLEQRNFPIDMIIPVGSERSQGKRIIYAGKELEVLGISKALYLKPQIALFSAGSEPSKEWAPKFAAEGCFVIDNSSAWRYDEDKPLIVPEVNGNVLKESDKIIANPNCSTIQLVMVLKSLDAAFSLERVIISTYQSVTGTGKAAVDQLNAERKGNFEHKTYPYQIDLNIIPQIDVFLDNGYSKEEMKVVWESRKILGLPNLNVTCTAVRIPVMGGHSESVNIEFKNAFELNKIKSIIETIPGVVVMDDPKNSRYPMPLYAQGKDEVYVGRIRRDESREKCLNLWIVSDNLRKGAATNAVQIAEYLLKKNWIKNAS
ncbi:MAG: aspartate-semialdehyde dehydrogenase [Cytophagales bacterium]